LRDMAGPVAGKALAKVQAKDVSSGSWVIRNRDCGRAAAL